VFLTYAVASLVWSIDFGKGLQVLAQFGAVLVAYVAGWRLMAAGSQFIIWLRKLSLWLLPASLIVFVNASADGVSKFGWVRGGNTARPMVMMLALLFLLSTIGRSRRYTLVVFGFALLVAVGSGGRMGTAVVGVLLILTPGLRAGWRARVGLVLVGLAALAFLIQFESIQERLFVGRQEGELTDIVTLEGNFNTAGRANNWPNIIEICGTQTAIGHGAGSAGVITNEATAGRTTHPHNDYLRTYCEFGMVGAGLFWAFFVAAGWRGVKLFRHARATRLEAELGAASTLALVALLMFAATDNIVIYTATFMAAAGVVWGASDRAFHEAERRSVLSAAVVGRG
jgi:O-antigen ligase